MNNQSTLSVMEKYIAQIFAQLNEFAKADKFKSVTPNLQENLIGLQKDLKDIIDIKEFSRKEYFLKEGQICTHIYFLISGLVRIYNLTEKKEVTTWFLKPGDFFFSLESFREQTPSKEFIVAEEDSLVGRITHTQLEGKKKDHSIFKDIDWAISQKYRIRQDDHLRAIGKSYEERYEWLMETHPDLIYRIRFEHLASYLHMSLSKFRDVHEKLARGK